MEKVTKAPAIRFRGFDDEWKKDPLHFHIKINYGKDYKQLNSGNIKVYGTGGIITKVNRSLSTKDSIGLGRKGTINKPLLLKHPFWTVDTLFYIENAARDNLQFLFYYFNTKDWSKLNEASGVPSLSASNIYQQEFIYPSPEEQTQIGELFKNLDEKLELEKEKHEKLKIFKKAMLEDMFPKEGEKVPKVRFDGFDDGWEAERVGNISVITIGDFVHSSKQNSRGLYPVYNGGVSYTGFYNKYNNEANKVIVSARGANAGHVNIVRRKYWAGNSCYSVEISNFSKHDLDFLYHSMKLKSIKLVERQQAANIPSVSKNDVYNLEILFPSPEEQVQIGNFFKNLDEKITLSEKKIAKIENFKKAMLEKMFV